MDSANSTFRAVDSAYPRQNAWVFYAGDTWRVNDKLTLDYGLRWDYYSPSSEKYDRFSFFDPVGANPGAGGRPGRLAFAGDGYGAASYGARYPEEDFYGGLAPRLGAVYSAQRQDRPPQRVGHLLHAGVLPGLGRRHLAGRLLDHALVFDTLGGIQPAFFLRAGLPAELRRRRRDIRSDYRNGQGILYRPIDANKRPYSHQWNITVDRELGRNLSLSVGLRRHRRAPPAVEHRPAQRHRPEPPVDGQRALRRVPARA